MRRALVPIAVLLASLLTVASAPAARPPHLPVQEEEEDVIFGLRAEGFYVSVYGEDNDGDQTAGLSISRDGLSTVYLVPAKITDHSIEARFGGLGRLDFAFHTARGTRECRGLLTFTGSFTFAGEGGYVHVDADHAHGVFVERSYTACPPPGTAPKLTARSTGVSLEASAGTPHADGSRNLSVEEYRGIRSPRRRSVAITASLIETRGPMKIAHGAVLTAPTSSFRRDLDAGTATLSPPAPFTGTATLSSGPDGTATLEGTLAVPVLGGGEPIQLTGPEFLAKLTREEPFDE